MFMYLLGMLQGAVTKHLSLEGQKGFQGSLLSSSMGWDVELGGCSAAARRVLCKMRFLQPYWGAWEHLGRVASAGGTAGGCSLLSLLDMSFSYPTFKFWEVFLKIPYVCGIHGLSRASALLVLPSVTRRTWAGAKPWDKWLGDPLMGTNCRADRISPSLCCTSIYLTIFPKWGYHQALPILQEREAAGIAFLLSFGASYLSLGPKR